MNMWFFSSKVTKEMLDIEVLELCNEKKFKEAVDVVNVAALKNNVPNDVVLMMLTQSLVTEKNEALLASLRSCLPWETEVRGKIYEQEIKLKLLNNYSEYKAGHRELALEDALLFYQKVSEEEFLVEFELFESALSKIRRLLKLYMEELLDTNAYLDTDKVDALKVVRKYGEEFSDNFKDMRILTLYWECLFFSTNYSHQVKASEFLRDCPKVARNIDMDIALQRAVEYNEGYVRKLLEIALQYDMDMYGKSKAVETLLVYQCDTGNIKRARETVKTADQLGIVIAADAMKIFLDAAAKKPSKSSLLDSIKGLFDSEKK